MNKYLLSAMCALGLAVSANVSATSFDISEMTCQGFIDVAQESEEVAGILVVWLDGYLSGITEDTRFDSELMESLANDLGEACEKSPDSNLTDVAKIVGTE